MQSEPIAALEFGGRAALITGAGAGLGRAYARLLGARGATVFVNDVSAGAAEKVAAEIRSAGGKAVALPGSVEQGSELVQEVLAQAGTLDILVNNAGSIRDRAFHHMSEDDWDAVYRVHVLGSFRATRAAWPHMRNRQYGRIVMTSSGSGLYGWFGQANYAMAKMGLLGLAQSLAIEGHARGIRVNTICPMAGSAMSATVWPAEVVQELSPESVAPLVALLCHERCPTNGGIFEAVGGWFAQLRLERSRGLTLRGSGEEMLDELLERWDRVADFQAADRPASVLDTYRAARAVLSAPSAEQWDTFIEQLDNRGALK